jgi:transketolase
MKDLVTNLQNFSLRESYVKTLIELRKDNDDIVVLDADLSHATLTYAFAEAYPTSFFNVGVAEQNLMGIAAGMSLSELVPFANTFALFGTGRAYEQIRNSICYPNLNVKIVLCHPGLTVGEDGATHQSFEDIALMRVLPNMKIISPCDAIETSKAIKSVYMEKGPVYVRIARVSAPNITRENTPFELGKGLVLKEGKGLCIISTGTIINEVIKSCNELRTLGINPTLINMHTIKPIDSDILFDLAINHKYFISVEEHSVIGGLGSAVAECLASAKELNVKFKMIGINDVFGQSGSPTTLFEKYGLDFSSITKKCIRFVKHDL